MPAMSEICPCPNVKCPNHGDCAKCTSRHLKRGYLNYCGYRTILPTLQKFAALSPESESSKALSELLNKAETTYEMVMKNNNLTKDQIDDFLKKVSEYSDY